MSRIIEQVEKWWQAEASRRFLWLPVGFGTGIGLYLGLRVEPPTYLLPTLLALILTASLLFWRHARLAWVLLLLIVSGATWAQLHTQMIAQPVLNQALEPRPVVGVVDDIVRTEHGVRLTLEKVQIDDVPPAQTPSRVRLSVRLKPDSTLALPRIGDVVGIRAGLRPPMGPALPHGFDFARYFYFRGIGAVGYGLPPWHIVIPQAERGFAADFRNWRVGITEDIYRTLPHTGGIAAGLVTGDARAITQTDFNQLRASNLYHIIAISGEHMVVIAGVIFVALRLLALLLPRRAAFRPQVKTIAAALTLGLVTAYLFVTGLPVSAVRAYVMIFLVLMAVILRRQVDPMRSLSITAFVMLLYDPAMLIDPGFQLSFAATLAIIALVEAAILEPRPEEWRVYRLVRLFMTMILISVVAEMATTPFVIAQFNNVSLYGVIANMLATPVMSFFLMPTVALYFMLLPFGLHHAALWLMDHGIRLLLGIASWIANLPHAQWFVPAIPGYGVACFALGLFWLCLWRTRARFYGLIAMLLGVMTLALVRLPDMLVGGELKQMVLHDENGYAQARGRASSMLSNLWANGLGYNELPEAGMPVWRCDTLGCVARVKGATIALPKDAAALAEDCTRADLVLTSFQDAACESTPVMNRSKLSRSNVWAIWVNAGRGLRIESSGDWQGMRPWSELIVEDGDEN